MSGSEVLCAQDSGRASASGPSLTWCGRPPPRTTFADATQALLSGRKKGHVMLCPDCAVAIKAALKAVTYRAPRVARGMEAE